MRNRQANRFTPNLMRALLKDANDIAPGIHTSFYYRRVWQKAVRRGWVKIVNNQLDGFNLRITPVGLTVLATI